jgi:ABC-type amino acid transport substrate-binding protein
LQGGHEAPEKHMQGRLCQGKAPDSIDFTAKYDPHCGTGIGERARMRTLVLVAVLLASVAQAAASTLDRVRERGTFTIAYRVDAKPYSYLNESGQPAGFIVDLCREVAAAVRQTIVSEVRISYVAVTAGDRFDAIRDGSADILCDPTTVTLARREMVDFSLPTYLDGAGVMSRDAKPVERFEDLKGKRLGVLAGTTTEQVLRSSLADLGIDATVTTVRDHRAGIDMLAADGVDAYFGDRAILVAFLAQRSLPGFRVARQYFSLETYALALPRNDSAFRLLVDRTLARLYRSGKVRALLTRTFGRQKQDEMLDTLFAIHALPE